MSVNSVISENCCNIYYCSLVKIKWQNHQVRSSFKSGFRFFPKKQAMSIKREGGCRMSQKYYRGIRLF